MGKIIKLTEIDLTKLVKKIIKEESKKTITEGIGTGLLILGGVGLIYLGKKLKNFIETVSPLMPSLRLQPFLNKIKMIESGEIEGNVLVKQKNNYVFLAIFIDHKYFDGITLDIDKNEIYSNVDAMKSGEVSGSDKIFPMARLRKMDDDEIEMVDAAEEKLINDILEIIYNYSEKNNK